MKDLNDEFDKFCIDYKILNIIEADHLRSGDREMAKKHHLKGEELIMRFHELLKEKKWKKKQ